MSNNDLFTLEPPRPTARRPLLGHSILLVEDSLAASETLRLMCCRSGARVRRADCLMSAQRHLKVYKPSILLVDMTLPDGDGSDLVRQLAQHDKNRPLLLAMSAHLDAEDRAIAAGADGFLAKPIRSLDHFQTTLVSHFPDTASAIGLRVITGLDIPVDTQALRQDITTASALLKSTSGSGQIDYVTKFITAIAGEVGDKSLSAAAEDLRRQGLGHGHRSRLTAMLRARMDNKDFAEPL